MCKKMSFALKYQEFLDKINNRVPIKWLTKPIDKIHPLASFFLYNYRNCCVVAYI